MRKRLFAPLLLLTLTTAACGGSDSTGPVSVAGTYALSTVNGATLPFTFSEEGFTVDIMSDVYVLAADGKFTNTTGAKVTLNGETQTTSEISTGTWKLTGAAIALTKTDSSDGDLTGTIGDGKMSLTGGGFALIYLRN